jgi:hypothetical protein
MTATTLVVASDIRNTLFRRALTLLDEVHAGLEDFSFGEQQLSANDSSAASPGKTQHSTAIIPREAGLVHGAALVPDQGTDPLERVLATFVQGRTNTARRAVGAVAQIHNEIDSILSSFERSFPPEAAGAEPRNRAQEISFDAVAVQPSEEVLRMAAATTAAAARFRVRAAEAAKAALQVYDNAAKQVRTCLCFGDRKWIDCSGLCRLLHGGWQRVCRSMTARPLYPALHHDCILWVRGVSCHFGIYRALSYFLALCLVRWASHPFTLAGRIRGSGDDPGLGDADPG